MRNFHSKHITAISIRVCILVCIIPKIRVSLSSLVKSIRGGNVILRGLILNTHPLFRLIDIGLEVIVGVGVSLVILKLCHTGFLHLILEGEVVFWLF